MDTATVSDTNVIQPSTTDTTLPEAINTLPNTANTDTTARNERIVELKKAGRSLRDIASELHISVGTVQHHLKMSVKKQAKQLGLQISREEISSTIFSHAPLAVKKFAFLVANGKEDVALRASADILDRSGFGAVQKTQNLHVIEEMEPQEVRSMLRQMLIERGLIVDTQNTINNSQPTDIIS